MYNLFNERKGVMILQRLSGQFQRIDFVTDDGFPIKIYSNKKQERQTIIVFNPICTKIGLITPLLNLLVDFYNVVTWEGRGTYIPNDTSIIEKDNLTVSLHLEDLENILSILDINSIDHAIGYCSGCKIACLAKNILKNRKIKSLSLVSPTIVFEHMEKTSYQSFMHEIINTVLEKGADKALFLKESFEYSTKHISSVKGDLNSVNRMPFESQETILMYVFFYSDLNSYDPYEMYREVDINLLIVSAADDMFTHSGTALFIHSSNSGSTLKMEKDGGHFLFYYGNNIAKSVYCFISGHEDYVEQ